jgi:hypothetical protein
MPLIEEVNDNAGVEVIYDSGWLTTTHLASTTTVHYQKEINPEVRTGIVVKLRTHVGKDEIGNVYNDSILDVAQVKSVIDAPEGANAVVNTWVPITHNGEQLPAVSATANFKAENDFYYCSTIAASATLPNGMVLAVRALGAYPLTPYVHRLESLTAGVNETFDYRIYHINLDE